MRISPLKGTFDQNRILRVPRCPDCYRGNLLPKEESVTHDSTVSP